MSIEVFMQVWCLEKSKLWWKKRKKGENSGHWFYCNFRDIFGALSRVHFIHTIYRFEAREVKSPILQTVSKLELKRKSYGHCKKTEPSWAGISHTSIQGAKIFAPCETPPGTRVPFAHLKPIFVPWETRCENFANHYSRCEIHSKVRKFQFKVRIL